MRLRALGAERAWLTRLRALAVSGSLALCAGSSSAHDAHRVHRFVVGRSSAPAVCDGLDASNDNRARGRFPRHPELSFRSRLAGGIGQAPITDAEGNLIVAQGEPRLSKLDAKGRPLWSERLPSEASCAPVLVNDGDILVVTRDAQALLFSASGKLLQQRSLPFGDPRRRTFAIPTASAGAFLASASDLVELDGNAGIVRQARAKANVAAIAESGSKLVAVIENGAVESAGPSGDFEIVGSFAGSIVDGAAVQAGKVFAVVDAHKWLSLDLTTGRVAVLASDPALALSGPAALLATEGAALVVEGGFVSLRSPDGTEAWRVALSPAGLSFDPALRALRAALVISDSGGAVAAVRSGNDALVIGSDGNATRLDGTSCLDPFRPTPTANGVVLSCRSGQLFGVSDRAP